MAPLGPIGSGSCKPTEGRGSRLAVRSTRFARCSSFAARSVGETRPSVRRALTCLHARFSAQNHFVRELG